MIASLTQLLDHYATRIGITMQSHPQGAQLTISVMPCPNKVKDDALRQQLIEPIVLIGDNSSLTQQLRELDSSLSVARENTDINQSVHNYLEKVGKASTSSTSNKSGEQVSTPVKKQTKDVQTPAPSSAESALDDMFV